MALMTVATVVAAVSVLVGFAPGFS